MPVAAQYLPPADLPAPTPAVAAVAKGVPHQAEAQGRGRRALRSYAARRTPARLRYVA